uniref:Carboxylesterase type B domain-containing protein n=1 Tax=Ditylenchus dipsaci TaxID=166011 RepID=A0A915E706_9BILA
MIKFGPRLDADFFTNDYPQLIESAKKKTTLMGATESEAITFTLFGALTDNIMNYLGVSLEKMAIFSKPDFDNFLVEVIATETVFGAKAKQVQDRISAFTCEILTKRAEDNQFYLEKYTEGRLAYNDLGYNLFCATLMEARYKTAAGWPVFLYFIDYFNSNKYPEQIPVKGSYHAVEYPYLLPENPYFPTFEFDQEDKNFQKHLLDSFISFTKTGQPSVGSTKWPALSDTAPLTYALLNGDEEVKVLKALASEKLKFWQNLRKDFDFDIVRGFHKKTLKSRDEL